MKLYECLYIISVSLQLSGAILLLIKYCFLNIDKGIKKNKKKETHVENECIMMGRNQPTPVEFAENIWLNRFAFALIVAGYLLSVWGSVNNDHKPLAFICILLLSVVVTVIAFFVTKKLGSNKNSDL